LFEDPVRTEHNTPHIGYKNLSVSVI